MTGTRVLAVFFGSLGVLAGATVIAASTAILAADSDSGGFYVSDRYLFSGPSHAVISQDFELFTEAPVWLAELITDPVDIRIQAQSIGSEVFIGIGSTDDVAAYLANTAHDEVTSLDDGVITNASLEQHPGSAIPPPPASVDIWTVSALGGGARIIDWSVESGSWTLVVMNADGSAGVAADLVFAATLSNVTALGWIGIGLGVAILMIALFLLFRSTSRAERVTRIVDLRTDEPVVHSEEVERKPASTT